MVDTYTCTKWIIEGDFMASSIISRKHRRVVLGGNSRWFYLVLGVISSFVLTIPIFLILSVTVALTDFPEEYIPPAVFATMILAIVVSAFLATAGSKNSGWFNGTLVGFIYSCIISILRWFLESRFYFDKDIITIILCGTLIGTIGGIAGINLTIKLRKFRSNK